MLGKGLRLYKREKLCSVTAISRLFAAKPSKDGNLSDAWGEIKMTLVYPLRMVYGENNRRGGAPWQFLISVPKKRLHRAIDRVTMRRRIREAYRMARGDVAQISGQSLHYDIAFIYVADELIEHKRVQKAMTKLLETLNVSTGKTNESV